MKQTIETQANLRISRLPINLVRVEHGQAKTHALLFKPEKIHEAPFAMRVTANFAGYIAGKMAESIDNPQIIDKLEERVHDESLTFDARIIFSAMVHTARKKRKELQPPTP